MQKNKISKINQGTYKDLRREKRLNGKRVKIKRTHLNPVAGLFSIMVIGCMFIMLFVSSVSSPLNYITYNRFIENKAKAEVGYRVTNAENEKRGFKAMSVIETNSMRELDKYKSTERLPMASTTKIMTAIVAIENAGDLLVKHKVPEGAVGIEGSSMYLMKDEEFSIMELLYGLMLPSGNDASVALSILVAGSEEKFVSMMNEKAKELGLVDTHFTNPHGLHNENHYTTAYDLAVITAYALKNDTFKEIVKTPNYIIKKSDTNNARVFKNKQKLLQSTALKEEGCVVTGVKTGFTPEAGRCLVTSATTNSGMNLVAVVLNAPKMFESTEEILLKVTREYEMVNVLNPKEHISEINVVGSKKNSVKVYHNGSLTLPLTKKEKAEVKVLYNYPELLVSPVVKEQVVGEVVVVLNNTKIYSAPILAMEEAPNITIFSFVKDIIKKF